MKTLEQITARTAKKIKNRRQSMLVRSHQELTLNELSQDEVNYQTCESNCNCGI
jgi:hypothetical protein